MSVSESEKEKLLKEIITELDRIYRLDGDAMPMPTNTKFVLNRINELLELADTNSLLLAPPSVKLLALGYALMLISHCVDIAAAGFTVMDPQTQLWLSTDSDNKDDLPLLAKAVRKALDAALKHIS